MWKADNTLELHELRQAIRDGTIEHCAHDDCTNKPTDVHHADGNHHNNAPGNLASACKPCHNDAHGITAEMFDLKLLTRQFYAAQDQRKAAGNQLYAYNALGLETPYTQQALEEAKEYEEHLLKHIRALLKVNPFYNAWLKHIKGVGPLMAASLISEIGSVDKFPGPRSLWAYAGLHVVDGKAPKRAKGVKSNWNPTLRTTCWKLGGQFVKAKTSLGRQLYDGYKGYYIEKDNPSLSKGQIDNRARRKVVKAFLRCMWAAWRGSQGLPVTQPQEGTWPLAEDWMA